MSNPPLICGVRVKWVYFQSKVELAVVWLQAGEDAQLDKTERGEEKRLKAVFLFLEKKKLVTSWDAAAEMEQKKCDFFCQKHAHHAYSNDWTDLKLHLLAITDVCCECYKQVLSW